MPSHILPSLSETLYPQREYNYYHLDRAIHSRYYSDFVERLQRNHFDSTALDWYNYTFGQSFPTSFVGDQKGAITFSPSQHHRWLVFVRTQNAVHMYLVSYIVVSAGRVRLYGDGPTGVVVDTNDGGIGISGVNVPHDHTTDLGIEGVEFL